MSSFRIDRQYVSFVTAEAHPVPRPSVPEETGTPEEALLDEARIKSRRMLEQAEREASEQSRRIIAQAEAQAGETLRSARAEAERLVAGAKAESESICEQARQDGNAKGLRQAEDEAKRRKKTEAEQLYTLTEELRTQYAGLVDSMRPDVLSLVMEIVRKVIHIKLRESDEAFLGMVNDAVERLRQTGTVMIRVGSEDYARYFGGEPADKLQPAGDVKLTVIEEEDYAPGDLVVESEGEVLDLSVDRQLNRIEKALRTEEESAP